MLILMVQANCVISLEISDNKKNQMLQVGDHNLHIINILLVDAMAMEDVKTKRFKSCIGLLKTIGWTGKVKSTFFWSRSMAAMIAKDMNLDVQMAWITIKTF